MSRAIFPYIRSPRIAQLGDNLEGVRRALAYLERSGSCS